MLSVPKGAQSAKNPPALSLPHFDVDPEAWYSRARATLEDLLAAAEDAARPIGRRQLGRVEHTRIIAECGTALYSLLDRLPGAPRR